MFTVVLSLSFLRAHVRWPFWLLIVAWACANSPQAAMYALVTWVGEARHFTHQQRLTAEVAAVLTGAPAPALLAKSPAPERPPLPPVPAEATLKKILLAMERTSEVLPPAILATVRAARATALPDSPRYCPPHEPPRAVWLS